MEGKYKAIYTQADVNELIRGAWEMGAAASDEEIALDEPPGAWEVFTHRGTEPTFPPDEPLFLLRGQDRAAPRAIADDVDGEADYLTASRDVGAGPEHASAVERAANAMREWQRANPDRVKTPD